MKVTTSGERSRICKFKPHDYATHTLAFASSVSRWDRLVFLQGCLAHVGAGVDLSDSPTFTPGIGGASSMPSAKSVGGLIADTFCELRVIDDPLHPAFGQYGLFAKMKIPSNFTLTAYAGSLQLCTQTPSSRAYTMGFGGGCSELEIDAEFFGNIARFANDPRGVPNNKGANLQAVNRITKLGEFCTVLMTRRNILVGEELLLHYGKNHRLRSQRWCSMKAVPVTRSRELSFLPCPTMPPAAGYERGLHLFFECVVCGGWTRTSTQPTSIQHCRHCNTAKVSNAAMSSALVTPSLCGQADTITNRASGTGATAAAWPLNFPLVPWQVLDPQVPAHTIRKYTVHGAEGRFVTQESISVRESQSDVPFTGVFASKDFTVGDEIGVVGGVLTQKGTDLRHLHLNVVIGLPAVCSAVYELWPTNEVRHIRCGTPTNCSPKLVMDALGCVFCALIASSNISAGSELFISSEEATSL